MKVHGIGGTSGTLMGVWGKCPREEQQLLVVNPRVERLGVLEGTSLGYYIILSSGKKYLSKTRYEY